MLLQWLFLLMILSSLIYGLLTGRAALLFPAALEGVSSAVALTLRLLSGYLFFMGMMELVKALRLHEKMAKLLRPLLRFLMPGLHDPEIPKAISLNLTANLLGLGNAATPTGIEAVRLMDAEDTIASRHAIFMLLILNSTSLQLLPTTVLTLRTAAGSASPAAILWPTLVCTGFSTLVGVILALLCRKFIHSPGRLPQRSPA
ncbi:MAG: spore maturation protein A [Clostridiales bacterium]|nr:spore maturation protein A [Clostridiales bacterium]